MTTEQTALWISVLVVGGLCIALMTYAYTLGAAMRSYIKRGDQSELWKQQFTNPTDLIEVERILAMFTSAYMFPATALWCLRPDDLIADLHQKCTRRVNDGVQMEILLLQLHDQYQWKPSQGGDIMETTLKELIEEIVIHVNQ